jgi:hypothetical protein
VTRSRERLELSPLGHGGHPGPAPLDSPTTPRSDCPVSQAHLGRPLATQDREKALGSHGFNAYEG